MSSPSGSSGNSSSNAGVSNGTGIDKRFSFGGGGGAISNSHSAGNDTNLDVSNSMTTTNNDGNITTSKTGKVTCGNLTIFDKNETSVAQNKPENQTSSTQGEFD